ncbi:PspC domain-containing protein [Nonomuraea africana]|uniref:Phage shock protein PspC (Stress-responsive transcriptional regulator) n=1 Tax=Nonomuraea africana TaxID=46171 RepID=A0ABR9KPH8_9ACTN|nr:PspC domain-containing protein [Nonomuraea africana]MBE1563930.1 phage shock protein PspC (stress-responsive transcriptional regulator) [Nonomuraea africana]
MSESNIKQLRRTRNGRIIAGVCSGIGDYIGIDANLVRIGLAIATLFGGVGIGVYAIGWLLMPDEGKNTSIVQDLINNRQAKTSPWQDETPDYSPAAGWQRQEPTVPGDQKPQA